MKKSSWLQWALRGSLFFVTLIMVIPLTQAGQASDVSKLSAQQKKALAQQVGIELPATATATSEAGGEAKAKTARNPGQIIESPMDNEPSDIEMSMNDRLGLKQTLVDQWERQQLMNRQTQLQQGGQSQAQEINAVPVMAQGGPWNLRAISKPVTQYGYSLFAGGRTTFMPAMEIPVPPEYVLGPGDELNIQFYGSRDENMTAVIDREGIIELPPIGPVALAGLDFTQAKALIAESVRKQMIGASVSISMGRLRSMRVFVLGDVNYPGSYLVSSLSTISNALFASGGVSRQGSLRHVQLKRDGRVISELDLYDFLLRGDSSRDERLLPGDVIFVPPIGDIVGVAGEVVRPGIYELKGQASRNSVSDVVELAGGLLASTDGMHAQINRIQPSGDNALIDVSLSGSSGAAIRNGDIVLAYPVPGVRQGTISLSGHVKRPGVFGLKKGMRLSDLIRSIDDLKPGAFTDFMIINRLDASTGKRTMLRPKLGRMLADGGASENPQLHADDKLVVLAVKAMVEEASVRVDGAVLSPGAFPFGEGMTVADLLMAAGGPSDSAYLKAAELTRYHHVDGERIQVEHSSVDLVRALAGDATDNKVLMASDLLMVRQLSNWGETQQVTLKGEFRFPGTYTIMDGENIENVIARAGGLTADAFPSAAIFTRESIRIQQKKELDKSILTLETDLAKAELDHSDASKSTALGGQSVDLSSVKSVLEQMKAIEPQGRLLIELNKKGELGGNSTLKLTDGDALYIPKRPDQVLVMGEVYNQTSMLYREGLDRDDYLQLAGGTTETADSSNIYIVRANGLVDGGQSHGWQRNLKIYPGDTIVVPVTVDSSNLLDTTLNWTKVLMQVGIFGASMKTIGIL